MVVAAGIDDVTDVVTVAEAVAATNGISVTTAEEVSRSVATVVVGITG